MNRKNFLPDQYPSVKQNAKQLHSDPIGSGKKNILPVTRAGAHNIDIDINKDPVQEDSLFKPHDLALTDC